MSEVEVWKQIPGLEDYEVSSLGNVRSWLNGRWGKRSSPKNLSLCRDRHGYMICGIGGRVRKVHHLVLTAFVGAKPADAELTRHMDGNPANNRVENLVWGSHKENSADRTRHGRMHFGERNGSRTRPERRPFGERVGSSKLRDGDVVVIRMLATLSKGARPTQREVAEAFGVSKNHVGCLQRANNRRSGRIVAFALTR